MQRSESEFRGLGSNGVLGSGLRIGDSVLTPMCEELSNSLVAIQNLNP